jgi:hypothetical protein
MGRHQAEACRVWTTAVSSFGVAIRRTQAAKLRRPDSRINLRKTGRRLDADLKENLENTKLAEQHQMITAAIERDQAPKGYTRG